VNANKGCNVDVDKDIEELPARVLLKMLVTYKNNSELPVVLIYSNLASLTSL